MNGTTVRPHEGFEAPLAMRLDAGEVDMQAREEGRRWLGGLPHELVVTDLKVGRAGPAGPLDWRSGGREGGLFRRWWIDFLRGGSGGGGGHGERVQRTR